MVDFCQRAFQLLMPFPIPTLGNYLDSRRDVLDDLVRLFHLWLSEVDPVDFTPGSRKDH